MKFIDVPFTDKICYISDDVANKSDYPCFQSPIDYTDEVLCEFINICKQDYKLDNSMADLESFCRCHGSLMADDWLSSIVVPKNFSSVETLNFSGRVDVDKIYYEKIEDWKRHILAFRDIGFISYIKSYPARIDSYNIVKHIIKHIVHFKDKEGCCVYAYFGSADFNYQNDPLSYYCITPEIRGYITHIGKPFVYWGRTEAEADTLENRQKWFVANARVILKQYQESYLSEFKVSDIHLLGKLQESLIRLVNEKRPLNMCMLCGNFFLPIGETVKSAHFCSGVCQSRFYQKRELYKEAFLETTAFGENDFKRLFNTSARKF